MYLSNVDFLNHTTLYTSLRSSIFKCILSFYLLWKQNGYNVFLFIQILEVINSTISVILFVTREQVIQKVVFQ